MNHNKTTVMKMKKKTLTSVEWLYRDTAEAFPDIDQHVFRRKFDSPTVFFETFEFMYKNQTCEMFTCFWLNNWHKLIGFEHITKGVLDASIIHPREVFRGAIVNTAKFIIVAHNHPSGNPEASTADIHMTNKIVESGKILDIKVLDHIIFAGKHYTSFRELNIIS